MTAELLALIVGTLLSLAGSYLYGFNVWYAALDETKKRLLMLAMLLGSTLAIFGLACVGVLGSAVQVTCDKAGAWGLLTAFFKALLANQAVFKISPQTASVTEVKTLADAKEYRDALKK
jgi:uncharacterized membrane protein YqjE